MVEWKIAEDGTLPDELETEWGQPPGPSRPRRWLAPLLLGFVLGLSTLGAGFFWQGRQREAQLRVDLAAVLAAESRAQAVGQRDALVPYLLSSAPAGWQEHYLTRFDADHADSFLSIIFGLNSLTPTASIPVPLAVALEPPGQRARVEVGWPETSPLTEQRVYQLEQGQWRRAPFGLPPAEITLQTVRRGQFVVQAPAELQAELSAGTAALLSPETLRQRMVFGWSEEMIRDEPITVTVEPIELQWAVADNFNPNRRAITLNGFDESWLDPAIPLPRTTHYRLATAVGMAYAMLEPEVFGANERREAWPVVLMLPQVTVRHMVLEPTEYKALRNFWRAQLGGQWHSPLDTLPENLGRTRTEMTLVLCSTNLFLEYLVAEQLLPPPNELIQVLRDAPDRSLLEIIATRYGRTEAELVAEARAYALTFEE